VLCHRVLPTAEWMAAKLRPRVILPYPDSSGLLAGAFIVATREVSFAAKLPTGTHLLWDASPPARHGKRRSSSARARTPDSP
jgi:hypothetical protein